MTAKALGLKIIPENPDVRHEATRVNYATRWRGDVAARSAGAAGQEDSAHRGAMAQPAGNVRLPAARLEGLRLRRGPKRRLRVPLGGGQARPLERIGRGARAP